MICLVSTQPRLSADEVTYLVPGVCRPKHTPPDLAILVGQCAKAEYGQPADVEVDAEIATSSDYPVNRMGHEHTALLGKPFYHSAVVLDVPTRQLGGDVPCILPSLGQITA